MVAVVLAFVSVGQVGCSLTESHHWPPRVTRIFSPQPIISNPLLVPSPEFEMLWKKTVAVLDKYFDIESENRLSRTIRTQPRMGATILEPWAIDSPLIGDRVEATLQTIRRRAIVKIDPAPTGGFLVRVEVRKELEDMAKPDRQAAGRAVFTNDFPVNRTREVIGPVPVSVGWIFVGRDLNLEQSILADVRDAFSL